MLFSVSLIWIVQFVLNYQFTKARILEEKVSQVALSDF